MDKYYINYNFILEMYEVKEVGNVGEYDVPATLKVFQRRSEAENYIKELEKNDKTL